MLITLLLAALCAISQVRGSSVSAHEAAPFSRENRMLWLMTKPQPEQRAFQMKRSFNAKREDTQLIPEREDRMVWMLHGKAPQGQYKGVETSGKSKKFTRWPSLDRSTRGTRYPSRLSQVFEWAGQGMSGVPPKRSFALNMRGLGFGAKRSLAWLLNDKGLNKRMNGMTHMRGIGVCQPGSMGGCSKLGGYFQG